jgi:CBS domain-containing protein
VSTSQAEVTPISEIMTKGALCVSIDLTAESVVKLFFDNAISGAPVIDERGHAIGVVSKTDLLRARDRWKKGGQGPTVGEIMTPVAFTMKESAPISQAAALMAFEQIHRLPIVSESGEVIGIVSSIDVLRWIAETEGYLVRPRRTPHRIP